MILDMLQELASSGVRFVVIGGVAARVHGSARVTEDLDICYDTAEDSLHELIALINAWNPRLRVRGEDGPPFPLDERALRELLVITLQTDLGAIDLLREVKGVGAYADCEAQSIPAGVGSLRIAVLTLPALIRAKRAAGRRKDQEMLLELEALAELTLQRAGQPIPAEQLAAPPPAPDTLADDLILFSQLHRLRFQELRQTHTTIQTEESQGAPSALPSLEQLARRIVEATRDPTRLAGLSPAELATVRQAHAVLRRLRRSQDSD